MLRLIRILSCCALLLWPLAVWAGTVKLGVLTELGGLYGDVSGKGAVLAAQMAADDLQPDLAAAG